MPVSSPSASLPAVPADKPRSPQQASRRFLTAALVVSLVAHIVFFAIGSQFPAAVPPPSDRLIEVTFVPPTPKKLAAAAISPHPPKPRHEPRLKPQRIVRVVPPRLHLAIKPPRVAKLLPLVAPPAAPKPLPAAKPVAPPKTRIAKANRPDKAVPPVRTQPATKPPVDNHAPPKNTQPGASVPAVPKFAPAPRRRLAARLPDEQSYPAHSFTPDNTHAAAPPANTNENRHQSLELADGSDAATGSTRSSASGHQSWHSEGAGRHRDAPSFSPDSSQNPGDATPGIAPENASSAAPGGPGGGNAPEYDANPGNADAGSTDESGFNHSTGLPSNRGGDNSSAAPALPRTHGDDDAAGTNDSDASQPSRRRGQRVSNRHHRLADNPFGDLPQPDPTPRPIPTPTPTLRPTPMPKLVPPRLLSDSKPEYPAEATRLHEGGTVRLLLTISPTGDVENVELEQSSGYADLDEAAKQWARDLKFMPGRSGSKNVESKAHIHTHFNPRDLN